MNHKSSQLFHSKSITLQRFDSFGSQVKFESSTSNMNFRIQTASVAADSSFAYGHNCHLFRFSILFHLKTHFIVMYVVLTKLVDFLKKMIHCIWLTLCTKLYYIWWEFFYMFPYHWIKMTLWFMRCIKQE